MKAGETAAQNGSRMRIYTSRFHNPELTGRPDLVKVAITVGKPKWPVGFEFVELAWLAPFGKLFRIDDRREFTAAYFQKLGRIGVAAISKRFQEISAQHGGRDLVLLCYENLSKSWEWCHRQVLAQLWLRETGEEIVELETGIAPEPPEPAPRQIGLC